ncbi:UDP-glucose 4-epimerase GalE [Streptomyces sp. TLI_171]|uniref:UDP-glucose 4-epimerase GalE n=1 Tax=Streptomyces sp. TLI_171 TaxID=1938859 RepID=UPI000C1A89B4|nr:UDP-glucose 4-epimerase GalE [Streptomyces sp. TLI_171]RKE19656.1 UDP-glucose 4-epimerase [Streptomyces sp. TLI_171]
MTWLITGGAGYIGGHVVRELVAAGESVVVLDDLSSGAAAHLPPGVPLVSGTTLDRPLLDAALAGHGVTGVLHLAAKKQVGESVEQPLRYYHENVEGLRTVLAAAVDAGVRRVVLSSSAAVYGMPDVDLVDEKTPCAPMNPYGETKLAGEWLLNACAAAYGLSAVSLRYFNVAGAAAPELSDPGAANLVPLAFQRLTAGLPPLIYGDDYPTPDGTCIRDYIHVSDVASAHVAAVRRLNAAPSGEPVGLTLNIGTGRGASVREMLAEIAEVTGLDTAPEVTPRRAGDPARVVASAELIRRELGWSAEHDLRSMVSSAWAGWQHRHP